MPNRRDRIVICVGLLLAVGAIRACADDLEGTPSIPIANGNIIVYWKKETASAAAKHLLIHFHGAPETVKEAFSRSELDAALAVVNFPGLSSAYSQPFQMDAGLFQQILQHSRNAVTNSPVADRAKPWQRISISSFSAGYGAVREILKAPSQFDQVAAIVAADSMGEVHDKSLAK